MSGRLKVWNESTSAWEYVNAPGGSLPANWTDGGHGNVTATADDNTYSPLTMKRAEADPSVTGDALILLVDETNAFLGSWDTDGGLQCQSIFVPNQAAPAFAVSGDGAFVADVTAGVNPIARFKSGTATLFLLRSGAGNVATLSAKDAADSILELDPTTGQTGDLLAAYDESYDRLRFRINKAGYPVLANNAAPADGDIAANECALWFDSTDGAGKLKIKAKTANGTVVSGSVNLT